MRTERQTNKERILANESIRRRAISVVYTHSKDREDCADLILALGLEKPSSEWYDYDFGSHLPSAPGGSG